MIHFESEEDMEVVLEGRPWLFRRQFIVFDRLKEAVDRENVSLFSSPFWIKVGPCPTECD